MNSHSDSLSRLLEESDEQNSLSPFRETVLANYSERGFITSGEYVSGSFRMVNPECIGKISVSTFSKLTTLFIG